MKKLPVIIAVAIIAILGFYFLKTDKSEPKTTITPTSNIPTPTKILSPSPTVSSNTPKDINLDVPFSSQAPFGDWSEPYQNACEETSALMVSKYYNKEPLTRDIAKQAILSVVDWENKTFGYYEDTTSAETARVLKEYFGFKRVDVIYDISIEDIKAQILAGRPVILPLAGQLLNNPNFTAPGPIYHMLVVKGITKNGAFITNDDGTKNGHNYIYPADVLYNAIHDAPRGGQSINSSELLQARKAMIVVYPN